jgi:transcription elongation factor GreA
VVIDEGDATASGTVGVGSTVLIEDEQGEKLEIEISSVGGVSPESPLGRVLLGRKVGDVVDVQAPKRSWRARIVSIS